MQRFLLIAIAAATTALMPLRAAFADELFTGPNPNWVEVADLPTASDAMQQKAVGGVLFLLSDEQVDWDGDEKQTYSRNATLVTDPTGLEQAATLQLVYAPEYESLTLTRLVVIRGDQVIDHTESAQAEILQREPRPEEGIFDGNLTAVVQVPDLRVGDVIDYSYMRRTLPIIEGANRSGKAYVEFDVPVVLSRVIVHWPESWPIYISGWPSRVTFAQTPGDGAITHIWTRTDHVPTPPEPAIPAGYSENTTIEYSAFPDWSAISAALSPHYMQSYPLGADWDAKLRAIQAAETDPGRRVIAALRAVQDDLRYVSLSIGAGGLLARTPEEVTRTGYGDCKDKALLLRSMLDKMGIEAYVALTDMDEGQTLSERKPSAWAFDHAIVKVVIDGATYFLDPTASHQAGDLYSSAVPDFGYALPLSGPDQQQLEPIYATSAASWYSYVDETYDFSLLGAYLTVRTTHYGPAANAYRYRIGTSSVGQISDESLGYYASRYLGLRRLRPLDVQDDKEYNQITVTETYLIPATALTADLLNDFKFMAEDYAAHIPAEGSKPRVAPMDIGALRTNYHRVNVLNAPIDFSMPDSVNVYNDGFSFSFSGYVTEKGAMTLEWNYSQTIQIIPPATVAQVQIDAGVVGENTSFSWDLQP
ncbi:MAG: DUF3857 domain-containing transglutaminase family protein [Paracoccaceae bacterium]